MNFTQTSYTNTSKESFLQYEFWILSFGGAFQRAGIYNIAATEEDKNKFRRQLKDFISETILHQYKQTVTEEMHIKNVKAIVEFSLNFNQILNKGQLTFGVGQKLLNLHLKYLWCWGMIQKPPHFPVDRIIQTKLKCSPIINWTTMDSEIAYLSVIRLAETQLAEGQSLADWELENFNRR